MVNSHNEEPDFDTDEEDESSFDDEGSSGEEEEEEEGDEYESGEEEEGEEEGEYDEDDDGEDGSEYESGEEDDDEEDEEDGSEYESGEEDDDEEDEEDGSEYESGEEDDEHSEDMSEDYSNEDGEDMNDVSFVDEEKGMSKRGRSSGSLMNEETGRSNAWTKCVPGAIVAMGIGVAALFCCCIIFIPILAIAIGLGVGLSGGDAGDNKDADGTNAVVDINDDIDLPSLTFQPSKSPTTLATTLAPTSSPLIPVTTFTSDAGTTIYRNGLFTGSSFGDDTTMLVQNGPPGDPEIASAYSLVQFDGIQGIDSDTMSVDAYLNSIDGLTIQFCLDRVGAEVDENGENGEDVDNSNTGPATRYSTCLLPSADVTKTDVETLTGDTAPDYTIPDSCVNGEVTTFEFIAGTTQICIDVSSLFGGTTTNLTTPDEDVTPALRGRRFLQVEEEDDATNATTTSGTSLLFMIDALDESDTPGDRFFSQAGPDGRAPNLKFGGENTCRTVADIACNDPQFSTFCSLVVKADLVDKLDSNVSFPQKTVFAPTNDAFSRLSDATLEALNDTDALVDVLLYHIAPVKIMPNDLECALSTEMANLESTTTLCGSNGTFYQAGGGVTAGLPQIIAVDIETCYGVIYVIDEVLLPGDPDGGNATCVSNETQTIAEIACTLPEFTLLCGLVRQAGIADLFSGGLFTIFAPTNDAFQAALASLGQTVDMQDPGVITNVLLQHVVWGSAVYSGDLVCDTTVPMANDDDNTITCKDDAFFVGGPGNDVDAFPGIVTADIDACNGVIHIIDGVLLPEIDVTGNDTNNDESTMLGNETPCGICGDGLSITVTDATIKIPDSIGLLAQQGDITCEMAEEFCMSGACTPETCAEFARDINEACGCAPGSGGGGDDEPDTTIDGDPSSLDILGAAAAAGFFNTLIAALGAAELVDALSAPGPYTVFAPTDDAFDALSDGLVDCLLEEENKGTLLSLVTYHVVIGEVLSTDLTDGMTVATLQGEDVTVDLSDGGNGNINDSNIETADIITTNGVIHAIDAVLVPPSIDLDAFLLTCGDDEPDTTIGGDFRSLDIVGAAAADGNFKTLIAALGAAELVDALSAPGPYTVFAPTDDAFDALSDGLVDCLLEEENKGTLLSLVTYHVVIGEVSSTDLTDGMTTATLQGEDVTVDLSDGGNGKINDSNIETADIITANGIIHAIDAVLVPPSIDLDAFLLTCDGGGDGTTPDTAMMQECNICGGSLQVINADALIPIPEESNFPGLENADATEATCGFVQNLCETGFCSTEICAELTTEDTKETCGCDELEI